MALGCCPPKSRLGHTHSAAANDVTKEKSRPPGCFEVFHDWFAGMGGKTDGLGLAKINLLGRGYSRTGDGHCRKNKRFGGPRALCRALRRDGTLLVQWCREKIVHQGRAPMLLEAWNPCDSIVTIHRKHLNRQREVRKGKGNLNPDNAGGAAHQNGSPPDLGFRASCAAAFTGPTGSFSTACAAATLSFQALTTLRALSA